MSTVMIPEDTLSPVERVMCYLQGKTPDRVACIPLILNAHARVIGIPVGKYNRSSELMGKAAVASYRCYGQDVVGLFTTTSTLAEAMGTKMVFFDEDAPQIDVPLIQELDDIKKVNIPDFSKDGRLPVYLEATEYVVSEVGHEVPTSTVLAGPFTTAAALRPIDLFIRDLYKNKEWAHELLEICSQASVKFADEILKRKGIPFVVEPIGSASLIGSKHFSEFVTPYLKRVSDHIHANGGGLPAALHICGKTKPNWQAMREAEFDIWSLDDVDMGEARETVGDRVTLWGNVLPANLLKNTPEEIDAEAKLVCDKAKWSPRGLILSSGCEVPIETPPENIDALINAARKYGRFDN